jgi:hypothetical protein
VSRTGSFDLSAEIIKPDGDEWKEKIAQAMLKKSGRAPTNEYLDGTGKLQWGSEKLMAISVDMCLADLRKVCRICSL